MYDAGKIIPGLILFLALMTFPVWYNGGDAGSAPKPKKPTDVQKCVRSADYMRTTHMQLLNDWRDEVLREGKREMIEVDGVKYAKSLQMGCMKCHNDKKRFCDECHTYASVKPYCWDCHFPPKEAQ